MERFHADDPSQPIPSQSSSLSPYDLRESAEKLNQVAQSMRPFVVAPSRQSPTSALPSPANQEPSVLQTWPCTSYQETIQYRCRCNFQILHDENDRTLLRYATRHQHQAVPLPNQTFPIATRRIQNAMRGLMELLHESSSMIEGNQSPKDENDSYPYQVIRQHLTSASFASSWYDDDDEDDGCPPTSDCAVTLHYNLPIQNISKWQSQGQIICERLHLTQLTGRSKGQVVTAACSSDAATAIRDVVWLHAPSADRGWKVTIGRIAGDDDEDGDPSVNVEPVPGSIPVFYYKHETAFCHPNARVMRRALEWMLNRLQHISATRLGGKSNINDADHTSATAAPSLRLVELYSGNGAHTMALAKSGLLSDISTVELDERLVQACHVNLRRNHLLVTDESLVIADITTSVSKHTTTRVHPLQGDAGAWARKARQVLSSHQQQSSRDRSSSSTNINISNDNDDSRRHEHPTFDILLVDPPRQGLDADVCRWALHEANPITDILYISCGHEALVRDLQRLVGTTDATEAAPTRPDHPHNEDCRFNFQVVDCQILDLFPQSSAVETLVHLFRPPKA